MTDSPRSRSPAPTQSPLVLYFTAFTPSSFNYQPTLSAHANFAHLCRVSGWTKKSPEQADARKRFKNALVQEFNFIYERHGNDLGAWSKLCKTIGIEPVPATIEECRMVVGNAHVNIVDLIDAINIGGEVKRFASVEELAEYTVETGKFFPKQSAKQGAFLTAFLREIINSYKGNKRNGGGRKKRRRPRRRRATAARGKKPA